MKRISTILTCLLIPPVALATFIICLLLTAAALLNPTRYK